MMLTLAEILAAVTVNGKSGDGFLVLVRFLNVWDTVAALGVPLQALDVLIDHVRIFRHTFRDLSLSPCVEKA